MGGPSRVRSGRGPRAWCRRNESANWPACGGKELPIGVVAVSGEFERGEVVAIRTEDGSEVARGLANYSAGEARLIMRRSSADIESILGFVDEDEIVHRGNMVLL